MACGVARRARANCAACSKAITIVFENRDAPVWLRAVILIPAE
jgi:hypothetical protein